MFEQAIEVRINLTHKHDSVDIQDDVLRKVLKMYDAHLRDTLSRLQANDVWFDIKTTALRQDDAVFDCEIEL